MPSSAWRSPVRLGLCRRCSLLILLLAPGRRPAGGCRRAARRPACASASTASAPGSWSISTARSRFAAGRGRTRSRLIVDLDEVDWRLGARRRAAPAARPGPRLRPSRRRRRARASCVDLARPFAHRRRDPAAAEHGHPRLSAGRRPGAAIQRRRRRRAALPRRRRAARSRVPPAHWRAGPVGRAQPRPAPCRRPVAGGPVDRGLPAAADAAATAAAEPCRGADCR